MRLFFFLYLVLNLCYSCASYESVAITGQVAQKTINYTSIFNESVDICNFIDAVPQLKQKPGLCDTILVKNKIYKELFILIAAYGKELESIAQKTDVKINDQMDVFIKSGKDLQAFKLNEEESKGLKKIVDNLTQLILNGAKRSNIRKIVVNSDSTMQLVTTKLITVLDSEKRNRKIILNH